MRSLAPEGCCEQLIRFTTEVLSNEHFLFIQQSALRLCCTSFRVSRSARDVDIVHCVFGQIYQWHCIQRGAVATWYACGMYYVLVLLVCICVREVNANIVTSYDVRVFCLLKMTTSRN